MVATADKTTWSGAFGSGAALDSIFRIASMTKALTTTAAMQLVEQGKLGIDEPVAKHLPALAKIQVLEGFDSDGTPQLRPARKLILLRHLLTHTAGFAYDMWDANLKRYLETNKMPARPWSSNPARAGNTAPTSIGPDAWWRLSPDLPWKITSSATSSSRWQ